MSDSYAFGEGERAAERLRLVAEVFDGPTGRFLLRTVQIPVDLAVDLGCGPGYSTRLLAATLRPARVVGDVRQVPFPVGPADLVFCRNLLAHLRRPQEQMAIWATQLGPGGLLLADEVESIDTHTPAFGAYLDISAALVASRDGRQRIGGLLDGGLPAGLRRASSRVVTHRPPSHVVARIFSLNLATWRTDRFVESTFGAATLDRLAEGLSALEEAPRDGGEITWRLRHIAFQRPA